LKAGYLKEKMIVTVHVLKEGGSISERIFIGKVSVPFTYSLRIR